jgi:hypothetical protein
VRIALTAGFVDATTQGLPSFIVPRKFHKLLRGHEESRHIGRRIVLQFAKARKTPLVIAFLFQLHRQAVSQKLIAGFNGQQRFDF